MRILITGANGFVGQHVILALQQDQELRSAKLFLPRSQDLDLLRDEGWANLGDYVHLHEIDTIIHLAAFCGGIGRNSNHPARMLYENLQIGLNVLDIARIYNCKLINLGSVCMYPKHTPIPFKESDIWNGYPEETNAPYGIAKRTVVEAGVAYNKEYGTNVINLIPVNLTGEHEHFSLEDSHVIPAMIRKFTEANANGTPKVTLWGDGSPTREFLYAGDLAQAIIEAIKWKNSNPQPINIGTGQEISMRELAFKICQLVGFNGDVVWDESKPNGQPRRCLDVSRAEMRLGFKAKTTLDEMLERTINWYAKKRL